MLTVTALGADFARRARPRLPGGAADLVGRRAPPHRHRASARSSRCAARTAADRAGDRGRRRAARRIPRAAPASVDVGTWGRPGARHASPRPRIPARASAHRRPLVVASASVAVGGPAPRAPGRAARADARPDAALEASLTRKRLPQVQVRDATLARRLADVAAGRVTGLELRGQAPVIAKAGHRPRDDPLQPRAADVTVRALLGFVLEPHGLVAKVEGNIVFVTTKADALGKPVLVLYPMRHLTWTEDRLPRARHRPAPVGLHAGPRRPPRRRRSRTTPSSTRSTSSTS